MKTRPQIGSGYARGAAVLLLGVFLAALAIGAAVPHLWSDNLARRIDAEAEQAGRLEAEARRLTASQRRLAALSDPAIAKSILVAGSTPGLNGAELQRQISELAEQAGISPQSLRVSDPQKWQHGLRNIGLEISMQATLEQLQNFLFDIETRRPLMFIDALVVATPSGVDAESEMPPLDISMNIRAIALDGVPQ